jgi:hypothetical protein
MPGSGTWVPLVLLLVWPPELEDELDDDELDEDELDEDDELLELFQPEVEPPQPEVELVW